MPGYVRLVENRRFIALRARVRSALLVSFPLCCILSRRFFSLFLFPVPFFSFFVTCLPYEKRIRVMLETTEFSLLRQLLEQGLRCVLTGCSTLAFVSVLSSHSEAINANPPARRFIEPTHKRVPEAQWCHTSVWIFLALADAAATASGSTGSLWVVLGAHYCLPGMYVGIVY